jgi:hypothetical protein
MQGIKKIAAKYNDIEIVYPVHLNPNVSKPVYNLLSGIDNITLLKPLDYEPFVYLMVKSHLIISDSGGIQEEAPSLGKPVLVTRNTTERPEAVETGAVKLVGTDRNKIIKETDKLLNDPQYYHSMALLQNPYGDGHACERIIDRLSKYLIEVPIEKYEIKAILYLSGNQFQFMRRHIDILHIISGDLWAGAEAQAFYTLSDLQKQRKPDLVVILFNDGILRKRLDENGIETIVIDENKHNALIMTLILARLIRKMRPAIIHVHAYKEHILGQIANMLNFNRSTMVRTFHGLSDVPKGLSVVKHIQSTIMYRIEKWF